MTERTTAERSTRGSLRRGRHLNPWYLLGAVIVAVVLVGAAKLMETPRTVSALAVTNPTRFDLAIEVSDDGEGWMPVGSVRRESTVTFKEIVDQGDVWVFRFTAQGRDSGRLDISKADLEKAGWTLSVPESVSDELRAQGAEFPP